MILSFPKGSEGAKLMACTHTRAVKSVTAYLPPPPRTRQPNSFGHKIAGFQPALQRNTEKKEGLMADKEKRFYSFFWCVPNRAAINLKCNIDRLETVCIMLGQSRGLMGWISMHLFCPFWVRIQTYGLKNDWSIAHWTFHYFSVKLKSKLPPVHADSESTLDGWHDKL